VVVKAAVVPPLLLALAALAMALAATLGLGRPSAAAGARYTGTRVIGRGFPKSLVDATGTRVLAAPPRRVASLTVTADEILTAIASPDRIAAVTRFADDPIIEAGVARAPKGAARVAGIDPERLISLEPDLVFVAHYTLEAAVRILSSAAIPVVRLGETRSYRDVDANVRLVGAALGEEDRAESVLGQMHETLHRVEVAVRGKTAPRVLYYSQVGYTSGTGTLVDEKIRLAGGRNVAEEVGIVGFKNVAVDLLVGLDPEVILVPRWSTDASGPVREVMESVAFRDVAAVKQRRVFAVAAGLLTSESPDGAAGVELVARLLHPEAFAP
jgi:iron complex transport system substrate-binding protein